MKKNKHSNNKLENQLEKLQDTHRELRTKIENLESKIEKKYQKYVESVQDMKNELEKLRFKESVKKHQIENVEVSIVESEKSNNPNTPAFSTIAPPIEPVFDDLTQIFSLDDLHERTLNLHRIVTYKQLANVKIENLIHIFSKEGIPINRKKIEKWVLEAQLILQEQN